MVMLTHCCLAITFAAKRPRTYYVRSKAPAHDAMVTLTHCHASMFAVKSPRTYYVRSKAPADDDIVKWVALAHAGTVTATIARDRPPGHTPRTYPQNDVQNDVQNDDDAISFNRRFSGLDGGPEEAEICA